LRDYQRSFQNILLKLQSNNNLINFKKFQIFIRMQRILIYTILFFMTGCSGNRSRNAATTEADKEIPAATEEKPVKPKTEAPVQKAPEEAEMIYFEGGTFKMGSENGLQNERPVHEVKIKPFYIDKTPVTVEQFRIFVESTDYKTEAEKFGDSGVFNLERNKWELLPGTTWRKPLGPSGPDAKPDHPVTHVSWNDAVAYASWAGKRLPTEAEWEYAACSGKKTENRFSWGNKVTENGKYFANTWQGTITAPEVKDGFLYTSPVGAFGENEAGLTDMGGNVWQWCADTFKPYPGSNEHLPANPNIKVIRSGSFFYDQNDEYSFTVTGRSMNSHETSLFNTGFRCAKDAE
jgi:formylglycine-generating enzyme